MTSSTSYAREGLDSWRPCISESVAKVSRPHSCCSFYKSRRIYAYFTRYE